MIVYVGWRLHGVCRLETALYMLNRNICHAFHSRVCRLETARGVSVGDHLILRDFIELVFVGWRLHLPCGA